MKTAPTPWVPNDKPGSFLIKDADGRLVASSDYRDQIIDAVNAVEQLRKEISTFRRLADISLVQIVDAELR
jgi:hypothetical protein